MDIRDIKVFPKTREKQETMIKDTLKVCADPSQLGDLNEISFPSAPLFILTLSERSYAMKKKVLVIDDDFCICKQIKYNLQSDGIEAYYALSISDALLFLMRNDCCLIILDITLSELNGAELVRTIRQRTTIPVLALSFDGVHHMERAYASGADDFLMKPFAMCECLLRAHALMRRYTELNPQTEHSVTVVGCGDIAINQEYRKAFLNGEEVDLTRKEFDVLHQLISKPDRVYTYEQIFELAWHDVYLGDKRKVINVIHRLRKKMAGCIQIQAVHDIGYRFKS